MLDILGISVIILTVPAGVAHLVERHLAKVEVASSSLVTRSIKAVFILKAAFLFVFYSEKICCRPDLQQVFLFK